MSSASTTAAPHHDTYTYKLTYFNGRGLAEISRLLFAAANVAYEDDRLPVEEDRKTWLAMKATTPFAKIPVLTVNGFHRVAQSKAIERFLARRLGFYGATDIEAAQIDAVVEEFRDQITAWFPVRQDEAKVKSLYEGDMRKSMENLNKFAGTGGFFVGDKLSYADISLGHYFSMFPKEVVDKLTDGLDNLKKIHHSFNSNERIQHWIQKRPQTQF